MTRRRYTRAEKAEVVAIAAFEGQTEASRVTGIPLTTINAWWKHPDFVELRTRKRQEVEEYFWAGIQVGLRAVIEGFGGEAKLGEKAVALGVLYDKYALLSGKATARTETHDWKFDDHETVERAAAVVVEELARRSDESAAEAAVGTPAETGTDPA